MQGWCAESESTVVIHLIVVLLNFLEGRGHHGRGDARRDVSHAVLVSMGGG